MKNNGSIWDQFFGIVILPPTELTNYALDLSKKLRDYDLTEKISANMRKPHVSILHFPLAQQYSIEHVVKALENLMFGGDLQFTGISLKDTGSVFLDTNKPLWLTNIAIRTNRILWGAGIAAEDSRFMERWNRLPLSDQMRADIATHHTPFICENFSPHCTLGRVRAPSRRKAAMNSLLFKSASWNVDRLHVVPMGDGWTIGDVAGEIPLRQSPLCG